MPIINKNIVFLDNLNDHWKTDKVEDMSVYSEWMDFIKVSNKPIGDRKTYTTSLANTGNQYAQSLLKRHGREIDSDEIITCGINKRTSNALKKWSESSIIMRDKYALFDWDGTICCTNLPPSQLMPYRNSTRKKWTRNHHIPIPKKEYLDDMFAYMINPGRVQMIRDLFQTLRKNGVHIHILTQNPGASIKSPYRAIYIEMIWRLFNESIHTEYDKQYRKKDGLFFHIYSYSSIVEIVSREEINTMLHSTIDYTYPNEMPLKRNILRYLAKTA